MADNSVGKVTPEERDTIRELHLRKSGLAELFNSLAKLDAEALEKSPLVERVIRDMGEVSVKFQDWWDSTSAKYGWRTEPGKKWRINFETCEIFLE